MAIFVTSRKSKMIFFCFCMGSVDPFLLDFKYSWSNFKFERFKDIDDWMNWDFTEDGIMHILSVEDIFCFRLRWLR